LATNQEDKYSIVGKFQGVSEGNFLKKTSPFPLSDCTLSTGRVTGHIRLSEKSFSTKKWTLPML
jgi:hypothetical protein